MLSNNNNKLILLCVLAFAGSTALAARNNKLLRLPLTTASQVDNKSNFCQGCRSLVSFATRFNSSSNVEENKKALKDFCETYYPPSTDFQQGPCPIFVEGVFYVIDRIDPVTHCDKLGACGPTNDADIPLKSGDNSILKVDGQLGNQVCDMCEQVVTQVQAQFEDPAFVDIVKRQTTQFCDFLAVVNLAKECRQFFEQYIDEAIAFVRQIQPLKACQAISLCSAADRNLTSSVMRPQLQAPSLASYQGFGIETKVILGNQVVKDLSAPKRLPTGRNPNCMLCKTIVKEMFKFLKENRTEESIRTGLDKICRLIYGRNQAKLEQCDSMVSVYSKELVQLLVDETDPELICMLLEQCSYQSPLLAHSAPQVLAPVEEESQALEPVDMNVFITLLDPSVPLGSIGTCVECKLFIEYLRNELENPKSVEEVRQWLINNLCNSLEEKKAKDSCIKMVNTYSDTFFKAVATEMDPKKACIELKACTPRVRAQSINNRPPIIAHHIKSQSATITTTNKVQKSAPKSALCDQCVQIVTQIDEYLSSHPIDHDVSVLVDEVCNKLPNDSAKTECTMMIKMFGQDIAQAISTMDSPKQLCGKIMLC